MQKLREYAQEILNLYNYFNGSIIIDEDTNIVYYYNNRTEANSVTWKDLAGKKLLEAYPDLSEEESTLISALKEGKPSYNMLQTIKFYNGTIITSINTTVPIYDGEKIVGAVEVSRYIKEGESYESISILPNETFRRNELYKTNDIITVSPAMEEIKKTISKVARTDSSVLIYGKTGTGKEMVAEAIHRESKRSKKKFVVQNCAAIPEHLLESILFGSIRGGFTGAEDRMGLLESANGGTVFLDEINNLNISMQAKILKAIEDQHVIRVGEYIPHPINVRFLAATNQNPLKLVGQGKMRKDLYYRLRVVQLNLLELKDRKEDIPKLTSFFINEFNTRMNKNILGLDKEAEEIFLNYEWPGNVRDLKNTLEGAFNFTEGPYITLNDIGWLKNEYKGYDDFFGLYYDGKRTLKELIDDYEKGVIEKSMAQYGISKQLYSELGISRQNLNHKIKKISKT